MSSRVLSTTSASETESAGAELASQLRPGDVVLVAGDIGAGKTTLIRGACEALGVRDRVSSPTYTLGQRYEGDTPVAHLDLYRLATLDGEDPALLDDYLTPDAIAFVEWPDVAADRIGPVAARVRIEQTGPESRRITIEPGAGD